jgi:glyoxylase I family protein
VPEPAVRDLLLRFEAALAARDPQEIPGGLMTLIADDFHEVGRSGRTWTRESIRDLLEGPRVDPVSIDAFDAIDLADDIVLVTYRTPATKRSSIWVRRDGRWQIRFHQGTPVPE